jgi:hypothetical protein
MQHIILYTTATAAKTATTVTTAQAQEEQASDLAIWFPGSDIGKSSHVLAFSLR